MFHNIGKHPWRWQRLKTVIMTQQKTNSKSVPSHGAQPHHMYHLPQIKCTTTEPKPQVDFKLFKKRRLRFGQYWLTAKAPRLCPPLMDIKSIRASPSMSNSSCLQVGAEGLNQVRTGSTWKTARVFHIKLLTECVMIFKEETSKTFVANRPKSKAPWWALFNGKTFGLSQKIFKDF